MHGSDPLGVFDDPSYAALALANADAYQAAEPFPHGVYDDFLPHDLADAPLRVLPDVRLDRVGRARQRAEPARVPARRDEAPEAAPRDAARAQQPAVRAVRRDADRHRQPAPRPVLHRRWRAPERPRRLPQDPRGLQLAPQAAGPSSGQRAPLPLGDVGRVVGRRDRVLGPRDERSGRPGLPSLQPSRRLLDQRALEPRPEGAERMPTGLTAQGA